MGRIFVTVHKRREMTVSIPLTKPENIDVALSVVSEKNENSSQATAAEEYLTSHRLDWVKDVNELELLLDGAQRSRIIAWVVAGILGGGLVAAIILLIFDVIRK